MVQPQAYLFSIIKASLGTQFLLSMLAWFLVSISNVNLTPLVSVTNVTYLGV